VKKNSWQSRPFNAKSGEAGLRLDSIRQAIARFAAEFQYDDGGVEST
jgi:hypothetical protein